MYRTGDVVCASYGDFNGEKRVGIFLVLYNERQDRCYSSSHSNLMVCKVTTNNFQGDSYVVKLYKGEANLTDDCLVNLSKIHTFTSEQAYKLLGRLSPATMVRVFKEYHKFQEEVSAQIMELF